MPEKQSFATIDAYIDSFPPQVQAILEQVRAVILTAVPEATETISYNIPTFDLHGQHLIFFAGWKDAISIYPLPAGDASFEERIAPYRKEKSTARFPLARPFPYDLVGEIVTLLRREKFGG